MKEDKYLVTGFSGFVSKHFLEFFEFNKINADILGLDVVKPKFSLNNLKYVTCNFNKIDLLNKKKIKNILLKYRPDYILHLASFSSVSYSWKEPINSFSNNTNIFLNLIDQVRLTGIKCRILSVGSSEEYGNVSENEIPINETMDLKPVSPYAVARLSQEILSKIYYQGYGLDIVMTRSFNHIGVGQKEVFAVPSFLKQLVDFKKAGTKNNILITGDVSIIRDFIDVRYVVRAYYELLKNGRSGDIYNICSGTGYSLKNIIDIACKILNITVVIKQDKNLIRPSDNKMVIGSNDKIKKEIGWTNEIPIKKSLADIIESLM